MGGAEQVTGWVLYAGSAVALALACWVMVRLEVRHPPACASALVVVLGGVTGEVEVLVMGAAVTWLALQAVVLNRLAGMPMPWWRPRE